MAFLLYSPRLDEMLIKKRLGSTDFEIFILFDAIYFLSIVSSPPPLCLILPDPEAVAAGGGGVTQ